MSWLTDLVPIFGGGVTVAGAMYGGCVAAEKAARPEALKDIGRILKDPSWSRSVRPSVIVQRLFVWTFGERQLSWKCISRSCLATISIFCSVLAMLVFLERPPVLNWPRDARTAFSIGFVVVEVGVLPDYISLWKTRVLLGALGRYDRRPSTVLIVSLDICLSLLISLSIVASASSRTYKDATVEEILKLLHGLLHPADLNALIAFPLSTLFTSVWTILILLSTTVLKLLAPIHRFTAWFFDVERHPVQAIGIVTGALVMMGSLIWTVLRAVI
jgi:hypothetical protein